MRRRREQRQRAHQRAVRTKSSALLSTAVTVVHRMVCPFAATSLPLFLPLPPSLTSSLDATVDRGFADAILARRRDVDSGQWTGECGRGGGGKRAAALESVAMRVRMSTGARTITQNELLPPLHSTLSSDRPRPAKQTDQTKSHDGRTAKGISTVSALVPAAPALPSVRSPTVGRGVAGVKAVGYFAAAAVQLCQQLGSPLTTVTLRLCASAATRNAAANPTNARVFHTPLAHTQTHARRQHSLEAHSRLSDCDGRR